MKKIVITLMLVLVAVVAFGQADSTKVKKKESRKDLDVRDGGRRFYEGGNP
jgi:hypothetical protein